MHRHDNESAIAHAAAPCQPFVVDYMRKRLHCTCCQLNVIALDVTLGERRGEGMGQSWMDQYWRMYVLSFSSPTLGRTSNACSHSTSFILSSRVAGVRDWRSCSTLYTDRKRLEM